MAVYDPRGGSPLHMDAILTQISVGWPNGEFLGPVFFPSVGVKKQSDKYYVFGKESWGLPPGGDLRAPGTEANEVPGMSVSTDTYFAVEHALQIPITDEEKENVDSPMQPLTDGTGLITAQLLLARELAIKTLMTTAANYASGLSTTLSGTSQWSDYTGTSDPILDVKAGRVAIHNKIFLDPNTLSLPYEVMVKLEDHPKIFARIQYVERSMVTEDLLRALFKMRIVTPGAAWNSANPGQAAALGYIWGKDVVMAYVPDRPGLKVPAYGYEFTWGYGGGSPQVVERWREEKRVSDVVRIRRRYDLKLVAVDGSNKSIAGYVIKAAVA